MRTSWAHYCVPKFNGFCSFLVNPLFIYLIFDDTKLMLGNYRWLLLFFAIFNMTCSVADMLVPVCVHNYRHAHAVFISGGPFENYSELNQLLLAVRCGFIGTTYGILHAHFAYRFLVLFRNKQLSNYFIPYGLLITIFYCLFHLSFWTITCYFYIGADLERKIYMQDPIMDIYDVESAKINMIVALYKDGSEIAIRKSITGIIANTILSVASVLIYTIIGFLIIRKLRSNTLLMSKKTKRLQDQLMRALIVQSVIPSFVSFAPTMASWYEPIIGFHLGRAVYYTASVLVSTFPFFDPTAIIFFIPSFRAKCINFGKNLITLGKAGKKSKGNNTAQVISRNRLQLS
ncbi:Serpentine Receptor, class J [Caenorhabditis elegans]|uniref:Serpentine Receptor, class J n=1 Tax=Caenorhabditis elegans TaxID=6239 RepID=O17354_CAEEL|nr:Serpentine Receptor, class J [Caenorhabditis elegans]CCD63240.1 Serpentine Receptor, class J [Caenorhabditis elegans]|eukprot:NP_503308.1 Serpentine Receptor, class J [Caenorhabditis elegans]